MLGILMNTKLLKYLKELLYYVILLFVVFFVIRIKQINGNNVDDTSYYEINKTICNGYTEMRVVDWEIMEEIEFSKKYKIEVDGRSKGNEEKIILAQLEFVNITGNELFVDDVLDNIGKGFEMKSWGSIIDPFTTQMINVIPKQYLKPGESLEFYVLTEISKESLREKTWNNINNIGFYYVYKLGDSPIKVNLGTYNEWCKKSNKK